MTTAEQIEVLDKEFVETMGHLQSAVATRQWAAFREIADHAGRVAGCLEILEGQAVSEREAARAERRALPDPKLEAA
jgi:hypothetical protein